ncbi:unnamed protein product [Litomosoides sigmodontis]|uniref:Autophagy-related protein 3 n=1 Tax=Litomosoides sigmodontis TaxID=42156 RepID=A0A3P6U2M0_LITSI|nr:unnamed protein product [Litomosoides sigmodontis]
MENIVNSVKSIALDVGQYLTPVLRESKFKETGVLNPEEFVIAGDYLIHHCPTWSWGQLEPSKAKPYLPTDKQFLITRNVPCFSRCVDMEYNPSQEKILKDKEWDEEGGFTNVEDDEGWVDTHHYILDTSQKPASMFATPQAQSSESKRSQESDDDDDRPPIDMDAFVAEGGLEEDDPYRFVEENRNDAEGDMDNVLHTRTYDLHITYDKYYQVPRLWLCGYDENNKPLTVDKMSADFSQDHVNKTITMESHPYFRTAMASIHPCRHAEVMKRLIEQLAESGKELNIDQYLIIFLKFVQAVIPTIEYDYTRSIQL